MLYWCSDARQAPAHRNHPPSLRELAASRPYIPAGNGRARRRQAPGVLFPRREKGPCGTRLSESKRDSDLNCKGGGHEIGTFCKNTDFRSFRRQNNNNKLSSDSGISSPVFACFFVVPRFSRSWRFAGHRGIDPGMFHVEHAGNRSHHGFRYRQQVPLTRLRKARLCHASSP